MIMRKVFAFKITTFCILMACLLQSCGYFLPNTILRERKRKQIGKYVIDMERTEWGEYEAEKDNYKDSPGDSVTAIITPAPQQNEQRQIDKLYFRKIGRF